METVAAAPSPPGGPKLESLNYIDVSNLSQSELQVLARCSDSSFDIFRTDDVVIPNIDRSLFNESAGGRRQTYTHLRGGYHQHHHHHTRIAGVLSRPVVAPSSDPETHSIIHYLKHYLVHNSISNCPPPPPPPPPSALPSLHPPPPVVSDESEQQLGLGLQEKMAVAVHAAERKRKRGRKAKAKVDRNLTEKGAGIELGRLNKKGEEVDFLFLENKGDELYSGELAKRTAGMETDEELLEFIRGLEGQWCSRRKRRKFVDASQFGDALPIGWKLVLAIRKREGRISVYSRRIMSPTGEQFLSCKEVSYFLHCYFEGRIKNQPSDRRKSIVERDMVVASGSHAGLTYTDKELVSDSTPAYLTASDAQEKRTCLMGIDSLPDVEVQNVFECDKCKYTFDERDAYLRHLMSCHQRTTRRYKFGGPVGEGVIIKDGKFVCQFCHKVFLERRSYNGHVGVHVRNHNRVSEQRPAPAAVQNITASSSQDDLQETSSKMNASIDVAQNSVAVTPNAWINQETGEFSCHTEVKLNEALGEDLNQATELGANSIQMVTEPLQSSNAPAQMLNPCGKNFLAADGELVNGAGAQIGEVNPESVSAYVPDELNAKELGSFGNKETDLGFMYGSGKLNEGIAATEGLICDDKTTSSSVPVLAVSEYLPAAADKKHEIITVFEELGLDDMEAFKYDFVDREEPSSMPMVSMDLQSDEGIGTRFDSSVGFDSDGIMLNMSGAHQLMTVCVWCRAEFKAETIDTEPQTDSIGYMCPTCKDKISGHFGSLFP